MAKKKQPEFLGMVPIDHAEYEEARKFAMPSTWNAWGFLTHNTVGRDEVSGKLRHIAYLCLSGQYFRMVEPLTDHEFHRMSMDRLLIPGEKRYIPLNTKKMKDMYGWQPTTNA